MALIRLTWFQTVPYAVEFEFRRPVRKLDVDAYGQLKNQASRLAGEWAAGGVAWNDIIEERPDYDDEDDHFDGCEMCGENHSEYWDCQYGYDIRDSDLWGCSGNRYGG